MFYTSAQLLQLNGPRLKSALQLNEECRTLNSSPLPDGVRLDLRRRHQEDAWLHRVHPLKLIVARVVEAKVHNQAAGLVPPGLHVPSLDGGAQEQAGACILPILTKLLRISRRRI